MAVGKVGRKGAGGAKGTGGAAKASGKGFGVKVDRTGSMSGASREVSASSEVAAADPVTPQALEIARQLKNGTLKNKEEAAKKLVQEILREKLRVKSFALSSKIAEAIQDDPRLNQALERLWSKG